MSNVQAALAISAAIIVLAGCVLVAAGTIPSPDEDYLQLFGGVISVIGLLTWYRAFRKASEKSIKDDDQRVIEEAIKKHRADQEKGTNSQ